MLPDPPGRPSGTSLASLELHRISFKNFALTYSTSTCLADRQLSSRRGLATRENTCECLRLTGRYLAVEKIVIASGAASAVTAAAAAAAAAAGAAAPAASVASAASAAAPMLLLLLVLARDLGPQAQGP